MSRDNHNLVITNSIQIPINECEFTFARSGGPGGQNVNKVNSKAILRWSVSSTESLPPEIRERFLKKYINRISNTGDVILSSQQYRDQSRNIDNCLDKLEEMIRSVAVPRTKRRPTKPTLASKLKRGEKKLIHSIKKENRRKPNLDS